MAQDPGDSGYNSLFASPAGDTFYGGGGDDILQGGADGVGGGALVLLAHGAFTTAPGGYILV